MERIKNHCKCRIADYRFVDRAIYMNAKGNTELKRRWRCSKCKKIKIQWKEVTPPIAPHIQIYPQMGYTRSERVVIYSPGELANLLCAVSKGARTYQEDRWLADRISIPHLIHGRGLLMGVMDGHDGTPAVKLVMRNTSTVFVEAINHKKGDVTKALAETVERLNAVTQNMMSGTTLSLVYVPDDEKRAYVAVLGDSPVVIKGRDGKI